MKVWIIRHGESETNKARQWTGWLDAPLTEKGRADAAMARDLLSRVQFDKIFTSDLSRAKSTAEIAIPACQYEESDMLREINVGSLAGKGALAHTDEEKKKMLDGYAAYGGESNAEFGNRVAAFAKKLEAMDYDRVAVFSHAGWLRVFLDHVLGERISRLNVHCKNCTVAIFDYEDGIWRLHSWINLS